MSINYVKPHHGSAAEYQVSSFPYLTASTIAGVGDVHEITFPYVTRWIMAHNSEAGGASKSIRVGFTLNGVSGSVTDNYLKLHSGEMSPRLECKVLKVFVQAEHTNVEYNIVAGLTNVLPDQFPAITGSNGFEGVG